MPVSLPGLTWRAEQHPQEQHVGCTGTVINGAGASDVPIPIEPYVAQIGMGMYRAWHPRKGNYRVRLGRNSPVIAHLRVPELDASLEFYHQGYLQPRNEAQCVIPLSGVDQVDEKIINKLSDPFKTG